ncbi:MAG: SDR family oxidoreductase [Alphaproteobacteria bacterium]|nr:SDR family oxidoreductase [Alphaproteobacteria bacterium]
MPDRVIAGSCALVTGGARGIGRAIAVALLREGVKVVIADVDGVAAARTASELAGDGRVVVPVDLDVRDREAFAAVVERIESDVAPVDILVNNAGIMPLGPFLEQSPDRDDRQIDINVRGVVHGMRAVLPGMLRRRRGHVVNVASVAGKVGVPFAAVYAGTKHAVVGLTEAVRHELRDSGVDLSYIMPAIVDTELTSGTRSLRYPPRVRPEQVADAVVRALRTGRVDVFVPEFTRLTAVLPILLPRSVVERVGRWFGIDQVFAELDADARRAYDLRMDAL